MKRSTFELVTEKDPEVRRQKWLAHGKRIGWTQRQCAIQRFHDIQLNLGIVSDPDVEAMVEFALRLGHDL